MLARDAMTLRDTCQYVYWCSANCVSWLVSCVPPRQQKWRPFSTSNKVGQYAQFLNSIDTQEPSKAYQVLLNKYFIGQNTP